MAKTKVFISYDHSEDSRYKYLMQAWDANPDFDFSFDSRGPNEPIDSVSAPVIKQSLTRMMKDATHLLVIVGEKTARSKWVNWEIERAQEPDVKLKLAAVRLAQGNEAPSKLLGVGTEWATSFERDRIVEALRRAGNRY